MVERRRPAGVGLQRGERHRTGRRLRHVWSVLAAAALTLALIVVPSTLASAASWGISKQEASTGPYEPGENVQWIVTISCSDPNADPCAPTTLTDPLPEELELVSASILSAGGATNPEIVADTDTDTVTFTADSVPNGGQVQISITAQVDPDLPFSADGVPITNTATVVSDNAPEQSASDDIVPVVPLVIDSETTKTIEPEGALAAPGTEATMTIGATNTSNDAVDTLVISDPVDPTADPNPFTYLEFTGFGPSGDGTGVTWPAGATEATVTFTCADGTTPSDSTTTVNTLPNPPDGCVVEGFTVEFSGEIEIDATATIPVSVQQSDAVEDLTEETTVTNDTASHVTHGEDESDPVEAEDTYVITPPNNSVEAAKSFDPATVSAGDPTTVTIGATNTGTPVTSMTITEPSPGTDSPFEGDDPLTFTGFGPSGDGTGVTWPANATEATVTFTCADGDEPSESTTTVNTLPNPPAGCEVVGFTVEFTGDIVTGGEASIPFTADTDPDQEVEDVTHTNEITANVPNAEDTASADLVTLVDRLATDTEKLISPSEIPAVPGQGVIVQLPSRLLPFGPDGSTTNADQVVIQDPTDPENPEDFWDHFEATSVRTTDVPADATLTINYWDGDSWEPAPDCGNPITGPATVSCDLPDGAEGVQFVYDSTGNGFPPGTQFQPNFVADFTGPEGWDDPLENCGASSASSDTVDPTPLAEGCDTVDPFPVDGDGPGDFIEKEFLGEDPVSVLARSDQQVTAQITWSTDGFTGVDPMVISDIADPGTTDIADSFYDAFNLVRVDPIDASVDPLIQHDQIESVELFIDGAWVEASGDPCPDACNGTFPGYTLTDTEQESATSVRLTYTESPSRPVDPTDPTDPQPGEGVARSTQADGRHLNLTFQVRDFKRSDGNPALGSTNGTMYNTDDPGLVNDTARGTATLDGEEFTDTDDDDVLIIDQPLNVGVTKDWTGGPISVPPSETLPDFYPTTNVIITGTNESAAKVDQLRLVEPGAPGSNDVQLPPDTTSPFNAFTLTAIDITPPAVTDTTTVTVYFEGGITLEFSEEEAEALTISDLADAVGVEVAFDGLVEAGASGSMDLTLRLREFDRYTGDPVTVADYSPVPDGAVATIDDPGGIPDEDVRLAFDDADMVLQDAGIALEVTKAFDPDTVVEPNHGQGGEADAPVVMTLTGQPQGPSRSVEMVLVDDDPQFWNQYDFVAFDPSAALVTPIQQVQVDAFVGGTFTGEPGSPDPVERTGGDWVEGTPSDTFALPAGVDPADVQGLRFTFSRTDGSIWENPANPTQPVPIQILRRDDMRSGDPVLPDLEANPPAPGETEPGIASNSVDGTTTGADLVVDPDTGELVPVSAEDSAEAEILYAHATNGVEIVKDFDGVVSGGTESPDATFPMNITFTNTGNRPIIDPVVTDAPMPFDAEGAQLRLADVDEPFSFDLGGVADPDPSTPDLPTDADQVTIDQTGDILGLEFSFPDGSVLEVGQSYTITVMVNFRLGLTAGTVVENTAGVTGDRPWDECVSRLNEQTGACEADADVQTIPAGVLAQSKLVKATNDDELDVIVDPEAANPPDECVPDADGFYAYPCTPVIPPGHDETWRIRVDNVGNLPMNKLVLYDRLPTPGDTGSFADSPRGSQWAPILTNDPPPQLVNAPEGAEATFYYSTVQDYCMDDINDPMNEPLCPTDDPTTGWVELTGDEGEDVYEQITALKAVITFPEDDLFQPADFVALEGTTTTPPEVPEAGDRSIAWNSAAASAVVVSQQGTEFNLLPTEGVKVGVATASGPLDVIKFAIGPGAEYAPETFELFVQCTSAVGTWVETELDPIPITVTPPEPTPVENLPYGAECTITEDGSNGETELIVDTVTIGEYPDRTGITAVNIYELGSLELSKTVESDATDQDGNPIDYGPFEATVDCTFLGDPVFADGYDENNPMVTELDSDGTPVLFTGLPVNAECTITETDTAGAASTSITVTQPGEDPVTTDGTSADVVIVPDDAGTVGTQVEVANVFAVGAIHLTKVIDGEGGGDFGDGPFTFDVVCTLDDDGEGPGEPRTVYDDSLTLEGDPPLEATIENLPAGAECEFTETDDGGATSTVIEPNPVTVGADETAEVTATNTFDLGAVEVDKVVDGDAADFGVGPFEIRLACTFQGEPVLPIPGGAVRELTPGEPVTYAGLPIGAECTVTETDDGGATSVEIEPERVTVGAGEPVAVTITNTFDAGAITVEKVVDGDGAQYAQGPYEVTLACTFNGADIDIPGGATQTLNDGESVTYDGLPIGAECTVTESDQNQATSVTIEPETVTVGGDDGTETDIAVTVTNTYDLGGFTVEKVVDGDGAQYGIGPFEVSAECTFEGEPVDIPGGATRELEPGGSVTYDELPVGAECTVTETDDYGATDVEISTTVDGGEPGEVVVPGTDDDPATITVTNTFDVGSIQVDKELAGLGSEIYQPGPFEVTDECTFQGEPIDIPGGAVREFMPDDPAVYTDLPVGAECTVTETGTFGATETTMTVDDGEPVEGTSVDVVVPPNDDDGPTSVDVTATNTFRTSPLLVRKTVDGDGADYAPEMPEPPFTVESIEEIPWEVTLECTFEGEDVPIVAGPTRRFGPGFPAAYFGLPDGAECTVTETDTGGATSVTVDPETVIIAEGEQIEVDVTNTYDLGRFEVAKVVDGEGAEFGVGPFEVSAECSFLGEPIEVPGGATRTVTPDEPAVYDELPVGAECVVTETDAAGATSTAISTTVEGGEPGEVVVPGTEDDPATITVTNTYDLGRFEVAKVVDGEGAEFGVGPFEVSAECSFLGEPIEVPGGATRTVTPDEPAVYDELPVGAECVVTETDAAGATSTAISTTVEGGEPGEVVVPGTEDDPATITVTNTYDVGAITVDKVVDGEGAQEVTWSFEVSLACTLAGEPIEIPGAAREISGGESVTYDGLPVGADCLVTETDDGGADAVTVSTPVEGGEPGQVVVPATDEEAAAVTVTNTFDAAPVAPPAPPDEPDGDDGGDDIPDTGADVGATIGLAAVLLLLAVVMITARRRRTHTV